MRELMRVVSNGDARGDEGVSRGDARDTLLLLSAAAHSVSKIALYSVPVGMLVDDVVRER